MKAFMAAALAAALLSSAASAQDTIKLAIGQRGNWDTSVSEVGQRARHLQEARTSCSTSSTRRARARRSRR